MTSITDLHPHLLFSPENEHRRMPVVCKDGLVLSVQASRFHYCTPRQDRGPHTAFEVRVLSDHDEELLAAYRSGDVPGTSPLFAWVPAQVIDEVIRKHGGLQGS